MLLNIQDLTPRLLNASYGMITLLGQNADNYGVLITDNSEKIRFSGGVIKNCGLSDNTKPVVAHKGKGRVTFDGTIIESSIGRSNYCLRVDNGAILRLNQVEFITGGSKVISGDGIIEPLNCINYP